MKYQITITEKELKEIKGVLDDYLHMKECDDFDANAVRKMTIAQALKEKIANSAIEVEG